MKKILVLLVIVLFVFVVSCGGFSPVMPVSQDLFKNGFSFFSRAMDVFSS